MRDNIDERVVDAPPPSLLEYVKEIRRHSLRRTVERKQSETKLPRHIAVGMVPKKVHEVTNFADYVVEVADSVGRDGEEITHFVDFGSGQNYLGRTLASVPYNRHIVAVESKENNIEGAKNMDVSAKMAKKEVVMRNKKVFRKLQASKSAVEKFNGKTKPRVAESEQRPAEPLVDLRPKEDLKTIYTTVEGRGYIQYVKHRVQDGDLSDVVRHVENLNNGSLLDQTQISDQSDLNQNVEELEAKKTRLMAISIHSCGNLSHHGIRSLIMNPEVKAIAIVGCCYNLMSERLGPPTFKLPHLRPNLRAINAPHFNKEPATCDLHGFPMSDKVATYNDDGIRLNITARMMAVQAPQNWTAKESDAFFTRHHYRALLQKIFLDQGVVKMMQDGEGGIESTEAVIIGSLRKGCYVSFTSYVRGAMEKLGRDSERTSVVVGKMSGITDEELEGYAQRYEPLKKELSVTWSLMAFSAGVVESLIVVDRWLFLKEHSDVVKDAWVEAVFNYELSPRNLVVVGIKR